MALIRNGYDRPESRRRRDERGRYMDGGGGARGAYNAYNERMDGGYEADMRRRMGFARGEYGAYNESYRDMNDNDIRRRNTGGRDGYFAEQGEHRRYPETGRMRMLKQSGNAPLDRETAEEWVRSMQNEDENREMGECWSMDEVEEIAQRYGVPTEGNKFVEFYAAMNAMYSDYYKVAEKYNLVEDDFFADLAMAFIDDKDAVKDKVAAYYKYIVKHD